MGTKCIDSLCVCKVAIDSLGYFTAWVDWTLRKLPKPTPGGQNLIVKDYFCINVTSFDELVKSWLWGFISRTLSECIGDAIVICIQYAGLTNSCWNFMAGWIFY